LRCRDYPGEHDASVIADREYEVGDPHQARCGKIDDPGGDQTRTHEELAGAQLERREVSGHRPG
jgi:hypothetical protein